MVSASLGLLAFLLAFTFGLAGSRYEARREVFLEEVNALGTMWSLRAGLLSEPYRTEMRDLLREYVDVRLEGVRSRKIEEAIQRSEKLHGQLWSLAAEVGEKNPNSIIVGLFIQSVNEVIDLHTKRVVAGLRSRIPHGYLAGALRNHGSGDGRNGIPDRIGRQTQTPFHPGRRPRILG